MTFYHVCDKNNMNCNLRRSVSVKSEWYGNQAVDLQLLL